MTDKEIILLFKRDSGMNEKEWRRFCERYATRDICTVIEVIKALYANADFPITASFKDCLRREMRNYSKHSRRLNICSCV